MQFLFGVIVGVELLNRRGEFMSPEDLWHTAKIEEIREITANLRIFSVRFGETFQNYIPGRFCSMRVGDSHGRPYSIVSLKDQGTLAELFIERIPCDKDTEESLTPKLWRCRKGDMVLIKKKAGGDFVLKHEAFHHYNHIMVATVTGISPIMAILREYLPRADDPNRFFVFVGASYHDELAYHSELLNLSAVFPDRLAYIATVSRPNEPRNAPWVHDPDNGLEVRRVNEVLRTFLRPNGTTVFGPDINQGTAILYACGNGGMIEYVREHYASKEIEGRRRWTFVHEAF